LPAFWLFIFVPVTCWMAFMTRAPAAGWPLCSSSMLIAAMAAIGLITFWPVYFGALPPIGSNMLTPPGIGVDVAAGGDAQPPWIMAPRSVMMSPNMLVVTITS
jgi:hypothetical protein